MYLNNRGVPIQGRCAPHRSLAGSAAATGPQQHPLIPQPTLLSCAPFTHCKERRHDPVRWWREASRGRDAGLCVSPGAFSIPVGSGAFSGYGAECAHGQRGPHHHLPRHARRYAGGAGAYL
ncbi:hypothetical protein EMIT048CA2_160133 [Pseudomonas chlororaphis]